MTKYAPKRDDGLFPYVRIKSSAWNRRTRSEIVWARSLRQARNDYGWTREPHTYIDVRRATPEDLGEDET